LSVHLGHLFDCSCCLFVCLLHFGICQFLFLLPVRPLTIRCNHQFTKDKRKKLVHFVALFADIL
jgi:hypothetical protein